MATKPTGPQIKIQAADLAGITSRVQMPALSAAAQTIGKQLGKPLQETLSLQTLQGLASRQTTLESVLSNLAQTASAAVDKALKSAATADAGEQRVNLQLRSSLIERLRAGKPAKPHRIQKDEYMVNGQIVHPKTGKPLPGVVVEAVDKDVSQNDLLGLDTTDDNGQFEIVFTAKDFQEHGEGPPEVFLRAGVDRENMVPVTEAAMKLQPGTAETVKITAPEALATAWENLSVFGKRIDTARLRQANGDLMVNKMTSTAVSDMGKALHDGLAQLMKSLAARVGTPASGTAASGTPSPGAPTPPGAQKKSPGSTPK